MDWAGCLQSAQSAGLLLPHPGIFSSILGPSTASWDLQQHPGISSSIPGPRDALQLFRQRANKTMSRHLCSRCFWVFPSPAVGNDTRAVIDHQARFGKGFLGHGSILISIWMGEMEPCTKISQGRHQPLPQAGKPQPCPIPLPLEY